MIGGGPAGSAAAIAAQQAGAAVTLYEQSRFPRHKVCGEYLSPEVEPVLRDLGVWDELMVRQPHRLKRLVLHFPRSTKRAGLPEPAWGLSRHALDHLLIGGVHCVVRERAADTPGAVIAAGRRIERQPAGSRQFGFKAHFTGPSTDTIELFFFDGCYVGVNGVEQGRTNVCGLGPEDTLRRAGFQPDGLLASFPPLRDRIAPLSRAMDWLTTGPLIYGQRLDAQARAGVYLAGDALSFVDPYTGSGMLSALLSGVSAGRAAAAGEDPRAHYGRCSGMLRRAYLVSSLFRFAIRTGAADLLLPLVPGRALVSWTRPDRSR